jgi:amphi-Trp domain-containing protein
MKRLKPRDIEKSYPVGEFVSKLRRLADALESGRAFSISVAGEKLRIPADARFDIEHEREGVSEELEFQLKWKRKPGTSPARRLNTPSS